MATGRLSERVERLETRQDEMHVLLIGPPDRPHEGMGSRVKRSEEHLHDIRDTLKWVLRSVVVIGLGVVAKFLFGG